jgi:hypothetical protein
LPVVPGVGHQQDHSVQSCRLLLQLRPPRLLLSIEETRNRLDPDGSSIGAKHHVDRATLTWVVAGGYLRSPAPSVRDDPPESREKAQLPGIAKSRSAVEDADGCIQTQYCSPGCELERAGYELL